MRLSSGSALFLEVVVSSILFIINGSEALISFYLSNSLSIFSFVFAILFLTFATLYAIKKPKDASWKKLDNYSKFLHALFIVSLLSYALSFIASGRVGFVLAAGFVVTFEVFSLFLLLLMPIFFLTFVGFYLFKKGGKSDPWPKFVIFAVVFMLLMLYFFVLLTTIFRADDEELLKLTSVNMLFNGTDPYSTSISSLLYSHLTTIGATITTNNTVFGLMDYPALFFLLFIPFYFFAPPTIPSLNSVYLPLQTVVFLFILLITIAYSFAKRDLPRPKLALFAFSIFAIVNISSITTYVMLVFLILAYTKIDSKYAWFFLGLCVSIQEELWLPVLFLIAYSANNQGLRRGLFNTLGTVGVFLIINSYFIAINPAAYFSAVFAPLNQFIMPLNPSPFSFMFLKFYPMLLPTYTQLFEVFTLFLLFLFLYWNRKELIPLFSLIPFLLLYHILVSYYAFFLFLFVIGLLLRERKIKIGVIEKQLRSRKLLFASAVILVILAMAILIYNSYAAYHRNFAISFVGQSTVMNATNNVTVAKGSIVYHNLSNYTIYLFAYALAGPSSRFAGLINQSLIGTKANCSTYQCYLNVNKIVLPRNQTSYPVSLAVPWPNSTRGVTLVTVAIYNSQYYYVSDAQTATNSTHS